MGLSQNIDVKNGRVRITVIFTQSASMASGHLYRFLSYCSTSESACPVGLFATYSLPTRAILVFKFILFFIFISFCGKNFIFILYSFCQLF